VTPHDENTSCSSAGLLIFLNRAPLTPLTRWSHSGQVTCRAGIPSTRLMYDVPGGAARRAGA